MNLFATSTKSTASAGSATSSPKDACRGDKHGDFAWPADAGLRIIGALTRTAMEDCAGVARTTYTEMRDVIIAIGVHERRGTDEVPFSAGFVIQQAAERYFVLMREAEEGLSEIFSAEEMRTLQDANPSPIWEGSSRVLATMVAEANGIDLTYPPAADTGMRSLLLKLAALTPLQNAALLDVCERISRGNNHCLNFRESASMTT